MMKVLLNPKAAKYIEKLNEPVKSQIKQALTKLEKDPPQGDIKTMSGEDGCRLRAGKYRILFKMENETIRVQDIGLRGQIYKKRG